jgi:imidazole glycerol-phosphate synthase subunit HisH
VKIGIIDYGMGNLFSVEQAVRRLGVEAVVTSDIALLAQMDGLILPGVGAFPDAMKRLEEEKLVDFIHQMKAANKPLLGICLGMQLLFEASEEVAPTKGLNIFKGTIKKFRDVSRIPHMGWNELEFTNTPDWKTEALEELAAYVYFVHSFYATDMKEEELMAYADYEQVKVPGIVQSGSFVGMQFHPEKSGRYGVKLLESWLKGVEETC